MNIRTDVVYFINKKNKKKIIKLKNIQSDTVCSIRLVVHY